MKKKQQQINEINHGKFWKDEIIAYEKQGFL